ncbi:hypothetical protein DERP_001114 [Dermatophagoides pteronyssinus]|uniref:Uncharacterized protein n=1 Tax=Dermatophagoides pteronyssinus TaxID=6956 RepID=A0ABQ8JDL1_DERPT|nr:hypothetical protein DERP_001114 [Dermatophagoides pteronyssinus]
MSLNLAIKLSSLVLGGGWGEELRPRIWERGGGGVCVGVSRGGAGLVAWASYVNSNVECKINAPVSFDDDGTVVQWTKKINCDLQL